jgi:VWFA-related protein
MISRHAVRALAVSLVGIQQLQVPTFRAKTDLVTLEVSVVHRNRPVEGLSAADFVVLDNGVRQLVDSVEPAAWPIDVTIVFRLDGIDPRTWWDRYQSDLQSVADQLRNDSLQIVVASNYGVFSFPKLVGDVAGKVGQLRFGSIYDATGPPPPTVPGFKPAGWFTYDSIALALMTPAEVGHRRLAVVYTDGLDYRSRVSADLLEPIAMRSEAALYLVCPPPHPASILTGAGFGPGHGPLEAVRFGALAAPVPLERLGELAAMTGGGVVEITREDQRQIRVGRYAEVLGEIFNTFKKSYLLRYRPRAVAESRWHSVSVTVPAKANYDIRTKAGYY